MIKVVIRKSIDHARFDNCVNNTLYAYGPVTKPLFLARDVAYIFGYTLQNVFQLLKNVQDHNKFLLTISDRNTYHGIRDGRPNSKK